MTAAVPQLPEIRASGDVFSRVLLKRRLGRPAGKVEVFAGHAVRDGVGEIVVVERLPGARTEHEQPERDARAIMGLRHPNLVTVRDVVRTDDALWVVSEMLEGSTLEDAKRLAIKKPLTLEVGLRIVVDVLAALSALHGHAAKLVHGWVGPRTAVVGYDGITRLARSWLGRSAAMADMDAMAYMAPEVLRGGEVDGRADVFSVATVLWEVAMGRRLFPPAPKDKLLARFDAGGSRLPKATPPAAATWAIPLADVIEKGLSIDPAGRYATTAEMAAAVRLIVRAKLALPARVASWIDANVGDRIAKRRTELALPPELMPRHSRPSLSDGASRALDAMRPPSRPPKGTPSVPPVAIPAAPLVPKASTDPRKPPVPVAAPKPLAPPTSVEPEPISLEPISLGDAFEPEPEPDAAAEVVTVGTPLARPPTPAKTLEPEEPRTVVEQELPTAVAPIATGPEIAAPVIADVQAPEMLQEREAATVRRPRTEADRKRRAVVLIVSGVCGAIVVLAFAKWAWVRLSGPTGAPSASATITATATVPTSTAPTTTAPATAPPPTATGEPTTTAEPSATGTATTTATSKPKPPRPKSTYDPQGI